MVFQTVELMSVRRIVQPQQPNEQVRAVRMTIAPESGGLPINIPYAPREIEHSDLGATFITVQRPGLPETTIYQNENVPKMALNLFVADKRVVAGKGVSFQYTSAIGVIQSLRKIVAKGTRVRISYGVLESGLWYITSMQLRSTVRDRVTNEITQAEVSLQCTRASEIQDSVGPVTGGVKPPQAPSAPQAAQQRSSRYYTIKRGDSLWGISIKFYGTGTKWRTIADANGIKDPRKLQVGKVIRIP